MDPLVRRCGAALTVGAVLAALAITLEAVTDPLDDDRVRHYHHALAAPVALLLFAGVVVLMIGFAGLAARLHAAGGKGVASVVAIAVGLTVAEVPHTVLDMSAIPETFAHLPQAQAHTLVDKHFDTLPGLLSGLGILPLLVGSIVLAVRLWNGGALPAWAPRAAVAGLALGIAELPLSSAAWWLPHGPVLLYLGLAAYGIGLLRADEGRVPAVAVAVA